MPKDPRGQPYKLQLTEGGLAHRLEVRLRLKHPDNPNILRRCVISVLVTWLPLLISRQSRVMQQEIMLRSRSYMTLPCMQDFYLRCPC